MIQYDLPMSAYRAHPGVSASDLKNLKRSAAYAKLRPSKPTAAKDWGTAVHTAILEPDKLAERYGQDPEKPGVGGYPGGWRNTTDYKARCAEQMAKGYVGLLTAQELLGLAAIAAQVRRHEIGKLLHEIPGHREASVFVGDEATELGCKLRPDWLSVESRTVVDVKSAEDHTAGPFSRACERYDYHISAAFYLDKLGEALGIENYPFLVVNSEPPYEVEVYTLDEDSIEQGRHEYRRLLNRYAECLRSDSWPMGSGVIQEIRLPQWAITFQEEKRA